MELVLGALGWLALVSTHAIIPLLIPVAIVGIGGASFGWSAPPHSLGEIGRRFLRAVLLFGLLFLTIICLFAAFLPLATRGAASLVVTLLMFVMVPLVACWAFGFAWRLGYDIGLLSAYIQAARSQAHAHRRRSL